MTKNKYEKTPKRWNIGEDWVASIYCSGHMLFEKQGEAPILLNPESVELLKKCFRDAESD